MLDHFTWTVRPLRPATPRPTTRGSGTRLIAKAYLDATVFYEPRSFSRDEFFAAICAQSKLLPDGALGILKELAASDKCMLGALNNEARETNEYRFDRFGLRDYFEVAFSSCYLGLRKPEPAIYRRALEFWAGRRSASCLSTTARKMWRAQLQLGMKTIRFKGADALRRELESLGVL